jgi:sugar phosphate permease
VVQDSPEAAGYEAVASDMKKDVKDGKEEKPNILKSLMENVLTQPSLYLLAFAYFFVYTVRQGVTSWFVFYLIQAGTRAHPSTPQNLISYNPSSAIPGSTLWRALRARARAHTHTHTHTTNTPARTSAYVQAHTYAHAHLHTYKRRW